MTDEGNGESRIDDYDYDTLMQVVFGAAVGEDKPTEKQRVITRDVVDEEGRRSHVVQTQTREQPNIALAMKLLDERIGGPQDFC